MSASENKKTKKRKTKKGGLSPQPAANKLVEQETVEASSDSESAVDATYNRLTTMIEEIKDDRSGNNQVLLGPNSYLRGDRCFLCRCDRTPCAKNEVEEELDFGDDKAGASSQLALWVCAECRKTVEEEERRAVAAAADIAHLRDEDLAELTEIAAAGDMTSSCQCQSCQERRQIEAEHELETQELQQCWMELRSIVRQVYKKSCSWERPPTPEDEEKTMEEEAEAAAAMVTIPDVDKVKDLVARLVSRDPHQLFQRLESQGREFVIEMKVRLLKQLTSGHNTPALAKAFVALLLQEYTNLCGAARTLASVVHQLEQEHMKKFNLTWELHNKHLFQSVIYHDPDVQDSLPMLITQLRTDLGSQETTTEDAYAKILRRYLRFDDEMSVIAVVWRDCAQLLDSYNDEQAALKAKQKMLKDDWEFFKAQRKLLEEQVLKSKSGSISPHIFEQQFTETMRQILQGSKPVTGGDECQCPNCNRKRCSCDECTITHMITCGLISPDVSDSSATVHHQGLPPFPGQVMSRYAVNVTPPSMSSTNTSSGSSSPISVDPERLTLPFEDWPSNFDLPDEIPEEIGDEQTSESSDSEGNIEEEEEEEERKEEEEEEEEDYDDEDEDEEDEDYDDDEDDEDEEDDEDDEDENDDEEIDKIGTEMPQSGLLPSLTQVSSAMDSANAQSAGDTCACTHCSQAKMEQARQLESQQLQQQQQRELRQLQASATTNQCQCHACLQQSGHIVAATLPQHIPTAPQPGALHLYPHIHGSNVHGLNTSTSTGGGGGLHGHMRPILQPHLFKMHSQGLAKMAGPKKQHYDFNLDLDSQEALQEHIYHAYGEWDNTYNMGKLVMGTAHKFGSGFNSDLIPPPPLINSSQFMTDPLLPQNVASAGANVLAHGGLATSKISLSTSNASVMTSHGGDHTSTEHVHTEACFKTVKSVGRTMLNSTGSVSTGQTKPKVNMNPTTTGNHQHVDHCFQHNPFLHTHHSSYSTSPQSSPPMMSAASGGSSAHSRKSYFPELAQLRKDALPPANGCARSNNLHTHSSGNLVAAGDASANVSPGTQSHNNNFSRRFFPDPKLPPSAKDGLGAMTNGCQHQSLHMHTASSMNQAGNTQAAASTNNNMSTGNSAPCNESDCDGHHEDNDSIDDSCSEQSSSTSASNQKDGKYCDCCYCEFFGHSNPPTAPISRNYAEMRERLRLRLKKRREKMPNGSDYKEDEGDYKEDDTHYGERGLDELIKFINGEQGQSENKLSAKAAKRARQKQRKAEERARQEAAERERLLQEEKERQAAKAREAQALKKKKKGKHKSNITNNNRKTDDTSSNKISDKENLLKTSKEQGNTGGKLSVPSSENTSVKQLNAAKNSNNSKGRSAEAVEASRSKSDKSDRSEKLSSAQPTAPSSAKEMNKKNVSASKVKSDNQQQVNNNKINAQVSKSAAAKKENNQPEGPSDSIKKKAATNNKKVPQPSSQSQTKSETKPENSGKTTRSTENKLTENSSNKAEIAQPKKKVQSQQVEKEPPQQPVAKEGKMNPALMRQKLAEHAKQLQIQHEKVMKHKLQQKQKEEQMLLQQQQQQQLQQQQQQQQVNKKKGKKAANPKENHVVAPAPPSTPTPVQVVNGTNHHCRAPNKGHTTEPAKTQDQPAKETKQEPETKQTNAKNNSKSPPETSNSKDETSPRENSGKNRRNKRKGKQVDDLDEIFMPRDLDLDIGEIDEGEREVEEFKRFCMFSKPAGERVQVNMNMKDLLSKKKISCA